MYDAIPYYIVTTSSGESFCTRRLSAAVEMERMYVAIGRAAKIHYTWRFIPCVA